MDLCLGTFRLFVVQWLAKIAGCQPQLKPLPFYVHLKDFHLNCETVMLFHRCIQGDLEAIMPVWASKLFSSVCLVVYIVISNL